MTVERVADATLQPNHDTACFLGGKIVRRGRVNATVEIEVRFRPDGPWFKQTHKVPKSWIIAGVFCEELP